MGVMRLHLPAVYANAGFRSLPHPSRSLRTSANLCDLCVKLSEFALAWQKQFDFCSLAAITLVAAPPLWFVVTSQPPAEIFDGVHVRLCAAAA
jgi:hypothetical protein